MTGYSDPGRHGNPDNTDAQKENANGDAEPT